MHITTRLIVGGAQKVILATCGEQVARGHEVAVVYGETVGAEGSLVDRARRIPGLELVEVATMKPDLRLIGDTLALLRIRQVIRSWRPDVVHTHTFKAGFLGRQAADENTVRCVVHTVHGVRFHRALPAWRNWLNLRAERWAAKKCHRIVCVSKALRDQLRACSVGRPDQHRVLYCGVDVDRFHQPRLTRVTARQRLGIGGRDFVIGTVARLVPLKGHADLLVALVNVLRRRAEAKLLWVGDGGQRGALEEALRRQGLAGQVIFAGLQPLSAVPDFLLAMDMLVHPSYREGLPLAVVEGMLMALPVVAYDAGGTGEICIDGETGVLLPAGDRQALGAAVSRLMDDGSLRDRIGAAGQAHCRRLFDHRRMAAEVEDLYKEVLADQSVCPTRLTTPS